MTKTAAIAWFVLALPLLAVGAAMSWMVGSTITEALRARNWVKTRAEVLYTEVTWTDWWERSRVTASYRYDVGGQSYESDRLGLSTFATGIMDDWPSDMHEYLKAARDEKRPIMVWVNPADPSSAVIDRMPGNGTMLVLLPIAFTIAGFGLSFLRKGLKAWREAEGEEPPDKPVKPHDNVSIQVLLWITMVWNLFAWYSAIYIVNTLVADGRMFALWVAVLPLIGLWLVWKSIVTVIRNWKAANERVDEDDYFKR